MRVVTLGLLLIVLRGIPFGRGSEEGPPEAVVGPIKILELGGESAEHTLEFPGTVQAGLSAELGFEVPGKIVERSVSEGQSVEEGALLARHDPRAFESTLEGELAKQRAAKSEYDRTPTLFNEDATPRQELDTRKRNFEVTKSAVERARKALEDSSLKAPFTGVIARISVENFETVQAKQPILVIENDKVFEVTANIPEQDAARIPADMSFEDRTKRTRLEVAVNTLQGRKRPRMLVPVVGGAPLGTAATSAAVSGSIVSEASGAFDTDVKRLADELGGRAVQFYIDRGWM